MFFFATVLVFNLCITYFDYETTKRLKQKNKKNVQKSSCFSAWLFKYLDNLRFYDTMT